MLLYWVHLHWHGAINNAVRIRCNLVLIRLLYQFPTWLQRLYRGIVWRMNPSSKVVYLTFDDGPIPECTPQVLDVLLEHNVKATYFMVAENAQRYPEILQRVRKEGHSVGNHTYHHLRGCKTSKQAYLLKLSRFCRLHFFVHPTAG